MATQDVSPSPFPAADGYDTAFPNPLQPTCQELYMSLESEPHDPNEQPAAEGPPTPTKQFSVSGSEYLSLQTTDRTDEENSYIGLAYKPSLPPLPPPPIQSPPIQPTPPTLQHPLPSMQSLLPHVQSSPSVAKKQTHSSLAQGVSQSLDPAQVDIIIQMLEKHKGQPGTTVAPQPPSPLPKKKDDRLYEDIYSLDISSETVTVPPLPRPPLPPDRPLPGKQKFPHKPLKADPFRTQPSRQKHAKESNLGRSLYAL